MMQKSRKPKLRARRPTRAEWEKIVEAIGPNAGQAAELLPDWIRGQREMCARLQECVQKHHLGLGGEKVDLLVADEVERLSRLVSLLRQKITDLSSLMWSYGWR